MNPIYLSMKAFGSYRDFTELDFTRAQQNLFLITGPTGSGKSTIFDAIVFALYGKVSAADGKKDSMLQSEFAEKGAKPEVVFKFSRSLMERDQVYTVRRVPHYLKKKGRKTAKGGAFTQGQPELEVTRPDGTGISGTPTEIQQALDEIIGLTKEQFMQVVMIAQGEFVRVLREDTAKKTEIFRKLFHTEIYGQMAEELAARRSRLQKALEETRGDCDAAIDRIRYPEEMNAGVESWVADLTEQTRSVRYSDSHGFMEKSDLLDKPGPAGIFCHSESFESAGVFDFLGLSESANLEAEIRRLAEGADYPACISLLEKMCERMSRQTEALFAKFREETAKARESAEIYARAKVLLDNYGIYEEASARLHFISQQEEVYEKKAALLKRLEEAFRLLPLKRAWEEESQRLAANQRELSDAEGQTAVLEKEKKETDSVKKREERLWDNTRREYQETKTKVKAFMVALENYSFHQQAFDQAEKLYESGVSGLKRLQANMEICVQEQKVWEQARREKKDAGIHMAEASRTVQDAERLKRQLETVENAKRRLESSLTEKEKVCRIYMDASRIYQNASERADRLEQMFLDNQAGILARGLKEGEPCPVCGAKTHPEPAVRDETADISQQEVETARAEKETLHREREKKNEALVKMRQDCESQAGELRRKIRELKAELSGASAIDPEADCGKDMVSDLPVDRGADRICDLAAADRGTDMAVDMASGLAVDAIVKFDFATDELQFIENMRAAVKNMAGLLAKKEEKALAGMEAAARETAELEKAEKKLEQLREKAENQERERVRQERAVYEAKESMTARQTGMEALKPQLIYSGQEEAEALLRKTEAAASQAMEAYKRADTAFVQAEKKAADNGSRIRSLNGEIAVGQEETRRKAQMFREAFDRQKLVTEAEIEALVQQYSQSDAEEIRSQIQQRDHDRQKQQGRMEAARKVIGDQKKPDMEILTRRKRETEENADGLRKRYDSLSHILAQNQREVEKLKEAYGQREDVYRRFRKVDRLYGAVSGARGQGQTNRISLETFVQRIYLKQVLFAANRRFGKMTMGAYHLELIPIEDTGARSQRGLDLTVRSMLTGNIRDISTLSGGESFMAALSMALGLSDQIQVSSGAFHPDMMFIDEGFGSLDDHTRSQAVAILKELAGNNRKIGVISHVGELKQSIEDQIVVTKGVSGSQAGWERDQKRR